VHRDRLLRGRDTAPKTRAGPLGARGRAGELKQSVFDGSPMSTAGTRSGANRPSRNPSDGGPALLGGDPTTSSPSTHCPWTRDHREAGVPGDVRHVYTNSTIFGPLEIVATGVYSIDWGDGDSTGPHAFEGKPWPDGRITHEYQEVGTYDIVVTERWTATWRLGGQSGVLRELRTTGRIDNFPVEQIQAVIGR
jgi:hypothetical protein